MLLMFLVEHFGLIMILPMLHLFGNTYVYKFNQEELEALFTGSIQR